jgi:nondiscriminating aspartyl-tRNA synthetase
MKDSIHRSHFANQLSVDFIGQRVRIGGWIEDIRDIGRIAFLIIRDVTGIIQAIVTGDDNLKLLKNTPRQSALIISGVVQKSQAKGFPIEI